MQDELAKSSQEDFDAIAEQVNGETKYAEKLQEQIAKLDSKIAKLNSEGKKSDVELEAKLLKEQELENFEAQRRNITAELGQRGMFHHGAVLRPSPVAHRQPAPWLADCCRAGHGPGHHRHALHRDRGRTLCT